MLFLCQTAGEVLTYFVYAPLLVLVFLGFCRLLFGKTPLCKQKSSVQDVQPSTTSVVLFSLSGCGQGAHVPLYVPLLVLAFLDLCALLRVWSTFDKRYGAAFRDFQRLLCARLSLCFKHAPRLVLVFLGFCRLLFGKTPLCKQKSSVQDAQPSTTSVVLFLCQAVGKVLTYFVYAPLLVLVFLDLCALIRVWSTFDKRYGAADFQRLLCA